MWITFTFSFIRYGIRAIDTSVYYGSSEIVLGKILHSLRDEFPRSSYQLVNQISIIFPSILTHTIADNQVRTIWPCVLRLFSCDDPQDSYSESGTSED